MRVFVTGGAGYVGSHCVRALVSAGHHVTVYDNLSAGHRQAIAPAAQFIHGDLADAEKLAATLSAGRFDGVMHFAAFLNVGESVQQPLAYYRNNVANSLHLLEAMNRAGVRRLVFSSSCAVYGVPETVPLREPMPKNPISPYGYTKLVVERMLADSATAWGLGSISLRYFNASGASLDGSIGEDHDPEIHLIPVVIQVALGQRESVQVFGTDYPTPDGSCIRDYIHVEDLADAHQRAIEAVEPGRAEAFNVGTGAGHSVLEVIDQVRRITGRNVPVVLGPRRPGDPPALFADAAAIRGRLGWEARLRDLGKVVESAWEWHRRNPQGFGPV